MSNMVRYEVEEVEVFLEDVPEVMRCLIHTIVFHRALSQIKPAEFESATLNIRYPTVNNKEISKYIDEAIEKFNKQVTETAHRTINHQTVPQNKTEGSQATSDDPLSDKHHLEISFYLTTTNKGLFRESKEETMWEKWVLPVRVVIIPPTTSGQNNSAVNKQRRNSKKQADLVDALEKRLKYILKTSHQKTDHLPSLGGSTSQLTFHGCYPFKITHPVVEENSGVIVELLKYIYKS
ncbi:autophagy-related protein 101 [Acrasis kona]|uniref:Autophagy-related protein 101 n=1 Tax=Acrasis kona TaxID=1008807 RepID=A0AAW2Z1J2_9EUKA